MQFFNSNDILYDKQFGFRKGHSTSHAIITLVEKVSKALDISKIVVGVYLDIRKAFDGVRHSTLLDKLRHTWKSLLLNKKLSHVQNTICALS